MLFSSTEFIFIFLPVFFLLYFAAKKLVLRNILLLVASLFFYAWGEHIYVFLMMFSIFVNWLSALLIERGTKPKVVMVICLIINLGFLGYYKYADFFIGLINGALNVQIPLLNVVMPLGISFYTFQSLSYVIDVYRGVTRAQKNPLWVGEYVAGFPQLIAGPIVRYTDIANEIINRHSSIADVAEGLRRFVRGLAKKVIIANTMASICDTILAGSPQQYGFIGAWVGIWAYGLQVFFDFSGYSDMAIGFGRMMGFHYLENFNYPFIARSVAEFWRRWHMTLSLFFRDYLYIPLGGSRVSRGRWVFNVMVVWSLTGLWHGASINFVLWGAFFGVMLIIERMWLGKHIEKSGRILPHVYLLLVLTVNWVLVRIESFEEIVEVFKTMLFMNGIGSMSYFVTRQVFQFRYLVMVVLAVFFSLPIASNALKRMYTTVRGTIVADMLTLGLFVLAVLILIVSNYNPFIYFRF